MRAPVLVCLLALAGCQPAAEAPAPAGPVAVEPPPVRFPALSDNARAVTGDIELSPLPRKGPDAPPEMKLMTATGIEFLTELMPGAAGNAPGVDWKKLFGSEVVTTGNPPRGAPSVDMHDIYSETVPRGAHEGGFCGDEPTAFIAMATGLEVDGQKRMSIAAFKGDTWPPEGAPQVCGVFSYAPPG